LSASCPVTVTNEDRRQIAGKSRQKLRILTA